MSDGGLHSLFKYHLADGHWQSIESFLTGLGIPDVNGCLEGHEFWIENKFTAGWTVKIRPQQIAWTERRVRAGGKVFVAVRRTCAAGPRREKADELHLFHGGLIRALAETPIRDVEALIRFSGGPARWDWSKVRAILTSP